MNISGTKYKVLECLRFQISRAQFLLTHPDTVYVLFLHYFLCIQGFRLQNPGFWDFTINFEELYLGAQTESDKKLGH